MPPIEQRRLFTDFDATDSTVRKNGRIVEICIVCAQNIGFAEHGGLQDNQIVWVAQRRAKLRVQYYEMRDALKKLHISKKVFISQAVLSLKSRVSQYPCHFDKDFIGENQLMAAPQQFV